MIFGLSCLAFYRGSWLIAPLILLLLAPSVHAAATLEEVLKKPYFDAADIRHIRKGGFGVAKIHEVSDREIAVVIACIVQDRPEDVLAPFMGDSLPFDEDLLQGQQLIDPDSPEQSFTGVSLGDKDRDEIQHYLNAKPGYGLNLTNDEISALQAFQGSADADQVEALLQSHLMTRYMSYRESGLAGALPYAREQGKEVRPGEELRKTEQDKKGLHQLYPDFHDAWLNYPQNKPDDIVADDYFWVKLNIDNRPAFVLSHRVVAKTGGGSADESAEVWIVGVRDYYISQFFDVSQRVAVVLPLESGEHLLVFIERAWVDYWSGFVSVSKKIGREVMKKQMEHLLEDRSICGK